MRIHRSTLLPLLLCLIGSIPLNGEQIGGEQTGGAQNVDEPNGGELPPEQPLWPTGFDNPIAYDQSESVREVNASESSPSGANRVFSFVSQATYTIHQPDAEIATGVGLVICPGGGYRDVWLDREGHDLALVLKEHGITSLVLKYRTNSGSRLDRVHDWDQYLPAVESDARRAIGILRDHADEWKLDLNKIGISGFSAGGNLAILTAIDQNESDDASGTPNFAGLFYPWLRDDYSVAIEQHAATIPPLFIINAIDDRLTPVGKCIDFYQTLIGAKVKAELHLYNQGGHGFDLGRGRGASTSMWVANFVAWLQDEGFIR